jgi:MFS family permease
MFNLQKISTDTTVFPWEKRTPFAGLRAILAIAIALIVGHISGHPSAGAIAAGAAYTIGFAVFHEALSSTLLSMALVTLGIASATLAGSLGAEWTPLVLLLVLIAAFNYGLLSGVSPTGAWIGQQCATFVIVASYFPMGVHYAIGRMAMVLTGGALQMVIFTLFHLTRRPAAESALSPLTTRLTFRTRELWCKLRSENHLRGDTGSYTARLAITLLLCTALYRHFHVRNGYWSPMTALLVLKPQWTGTLSRSIARLAGTLVGAGIALLLAFYMPIHLAIVFTLVIVCAWASYAFQDVNYALFSLFVTLYIVFLFRFGGFSQASAAHIRLFNTALGGAVALTVDSLWKLLAPKARRLRTIERL